jgi:hypothetical protein
MKNNSVPVFIANVLKTYSAILRIPQRQLLSLILTDWAARNSAEMDYLGETLSNPFIYQDDDLEMLFLALRQKYAEMLLSGLGK